MLPVKTSLLQITETKTWTLSLLWLYKRLHVRIITFWSETGSFSLLAPVIIYSSGSAGWQSQQCGGRAADQQGSGWASGLICSACSGRFLPALTPTPPRDQRHCGRTHELLRVGDKSVKWFHLNTPQGTFNWPWSRLSLILMPPQEQAMLNVSVKLL